MQESRFYEEFKDADQGDLDDAFVWACLKGELDKVKYLLTSPELKLHANIHTEGENGLIVAFKKEQLSVVKYLLSSPELSEHANLYADKAKAFKAAFFSDEPYIFEYLIFELNIQKTEDIADYLNQYKETELVQKVIKMFDTRELQKNLDDNLSNATVKSSKKPKL